MDIGLPPASPSDKDIDLKVKLSSRIDWNMTYCTRRQYYEQFSLYLGMK